MKGNKLTVKGLQRLDAMLGLGKKSAATRNTFEALMIETVSGINDKGKGVIELPFIGDIHFEQKEGVSEDGENNLNITKFCPDESLITGLSEMVSDDNECSELIMGIQDRITEAFEKVILGE